MTHPFRMLALLALVVLAVVPGAAHAQQMIAYVDSEYILDRLPEYATVQEQVDRLAQEWEGELRERQDRIDELFQAYQARELLYTNEERQRKQEEIIRAEEELERLRMQYFGPEGQLFDEQDRLLRPIQERILTAVQEVASAEGYDYVFDKTSDYLFLFAREQYNVSDRVLEELGIDIEGTGRSGR